MKLFLAIFLAVQVALFVDVDGYAVRTFKMFNPTTLAEDVVIIIIGYNADNPMENDSWKKGIENDFDLKISRAIESELSFKGQSFVPSDARSDKWLSYVHVPSEHQVVDSWDKWIPKGSQFHGSDISYISTNYEKSFKWESFIPSKFRSYNWQSFVPSQSRSFNWQSFIRSKHDSH